ncbi:MAG: hypothetical protein H0X25_19290 [Acidobacteriales bacterium]|nr:hypothetical protein [Terriglobales bacterium]
MKLGTIPFLLLLSLAPFARAQESPYFVTYDHHLEEPGNLEIETQSTVGFPRNGQPNYFAPYTELEYGVTGWWTSELYVEGQTTSGQGGVFTGWRWENRFRPLAREHWINPVLYVEYESLNEASKIQKEIVGNDTANFDPNSEGGNIPAHELETKLILSSTVHDWNIAENFIVEKNLSEGEGFEFGYSVGASRPLKTIASGNECRFCRENFIAGVEMYGGLGSTLGFGLHETSHYLAPVLGWQLSDNSSLRLSPGFGLNSNSNHVLLRMGYSYEIRDFASRVSRMFGGRR